MTDASSSAYPYLYPNPAAFPNGMAMTPNPFGTPQGGLNGMYPMGMGMGMGMSNAPGYGPSGMYPMQSPYHPQHFGYPYRPPSLLSQLPWWFLPLMIMMCAFLILWYSNPSWLRASARTADPPCPDLPSASEINTDNKESDTSGRNWFKLLVASIATAVVGSIGFVVYRMIQRRQQNNQASNAAAVPSANGPQPGSSALGTDPSRSG